MGPQFVPLPVSSLSVWGFKYGPLFCKWWVCKDFRCILRADGWDRAVVLLHSVCLHSGPEYILHVSYPLWGLHRARLKMDPGCFVRVILWSH